MDPLFIEAGQQYGIDPELLWAIYGIESNYGQNMGPSSAGALGHMQFMPSTIEDMRRKGIEIDPFDKRSAVMGAAAYLNMQKPLVGSDPRRLALAYHSGAQNVLTNNIGPAGRDYLKKLDERYDMPGYVAQEQAMPSAGQMALLQYLMQNQQQAPMPQLPQEQPNFAERLMADPFFMGGMGILASPGGYGTSPLVGAARGLLGGWGGMVTAQDRLASNASKRAALEHKIASDRQREEARQRVAMMESLGMTPPPSLIAMAYPEAASTLYKTPDLPTSYREWQAMQSMGSPMTYPEFMDKFGRGQKIAIDIQQKAEDMSLGRVLGEEAGKVITGQNRTEDNLSRLSVAESELQKILQQGGTTGPLTDWAAWGSALSQRLGVDPAKLGLPANAGPYETLDAVLKELALGKIGGENGMPANNFSDADRRFIESTVGSLADTPQGLMKKLNVIRAANERSAERARVYRRLAAQGMNAMQIAEYWDQYVQENPLVIRNEDDFAKVKPGAYYVDPDGMLRQKR